MTQNFSTRAIAKGILCATATVLMLLGALLLAGSASAEPVNEQGSEAPPLETVAEVVPPVEPVVEQVKEAPPVETVAEVLPPVEPVVEQVKEAPPVEQVAEVAPPTEPVVEEIKEAPPVEKVAEVVPPVEPVVEKVKEAAEEVVPPVVEPVKELLTAVETNKEQLDASATSPSGPGTGPQAGAAPSTASTPAPSVLVASLMTPPTSSEPGEPPTASTALGSGSTHLTAVQRAVELSCQLSGLAGSATDNCTASWLSNQPLLATSPGALVIATPTRMSAPTDDGSDGSGGSYGGGTRSFIPPPGPAPSGAVGGSAAAGSGVGLSGFFTLAGQLRLAGPRAMRRLRLSSKPWLTAFFVLIPERPG